mgnify:CR=1 FL=1
MDFNYENTTITSSGAFIPSKKNAPLDARGMVDKFEDINYIAECGEYEKLSSDLKELASLRVENPDISLSELAKLFDPPITRSGVNHRIERIRKIADELRERRK